MALLANKQARTKEFLSLYVAGETPIGEAVARLKNDVDAAVTARKGNSDRLQEAAKTLIQHLKQQKTLPKNGLALFAGAYPEADTEKELLHMEERYPRRP